MIYELRLDTSRIFMTFYNIRINILPQNITNKNIINKSMNKIDFYKLT